MRLIGICSTAFVVTVLSTACRSVGPTRIVHDRFDYAEAISNSWKNQMLLNLVKLRYADAPMLLDVTSVLAQYTLEGQASAVGNFPDLSGRKGWGVAASGHWAERPTITYVPVSGQRFTRSLLTPIDPAAVMSLVQSGWAIDSIFRLCVRTINGIHAGTRMRLAGQTEDPRFQTLLDAFRRLQLADGVDIRVERQKESEAAVLVVPGIDNPATREDRRLIVELLKLDPGVTEFALATGSINRTGREIALQTRSMVEVLSDMSFDIRVPEAHVSDGRTGLPVTAPGISQGQFKVASGSEQPSDAFASVRYQGYWFWIENRDFASKRGLSLLMVLLSLAETGTAGAVPGLTVSAGP